MASKKKGHWLNAVIRKHNRKVRKMARKKKKKTRSFGGLGTGKRESAGFSVDVQINTNIGASNVRAFTSQACVTKRGSRRRTNYFNHRCGTGAGANPTAAAKKALASLARNLKRRG